MNKILLDTSVIVDFLRVKNKDFTLLQNLADQNYQLCISIITHTELYAGKSIWESNDARKKLELILSGLSILNMDERISRKSGEIRALYNLDIADAIIAATALQHKLNLATLNIKDFEKIKELHLV